MRVAKFKKLTLKAKKQIFAEYLNNVHPHLGKEVIETIINAELCIDEKLVHLASRQWSVNVTDNLEEFQDTLALQNIGTIFVQSGTEIRSVSRGFWLVGSGEFGENLNLKIVLNAITNPTFEISQCEGVINDPNTLQVVAITTAEWDNTAEFASDHHWDLWIYNPGLKKSVCENLK